MTKSTFDEPWVDIMFPKTGALETTWRLISYKKLQHAIRCVNALAGMSDNEIDCIKAKLAHAEEKFRRVIERMGECEEREVAFKGLNPDAVQELIDIALKLFRDSGNVPQTLDEFVERLKLRESLWEKLNAALARLEGGA